MKKILSIILAILLGLSVLAFAEEYKTPVPPFGKIKEIALRSPSQYGTYETVFEVSENDHRIVYGFVYASADNAYGVHECIAIYKVAESKEVYGQCLTCGNFYAKIRDELLHPPKDTVIAGAYKLFRELVDKNLI